MLNPFLATAYVRALQILWADRDANPVIALAVEDDPAEAGARSAPEWLAPVEVFGLAHNQICELSAGQKFLADLRRIVDQTEPAAVFMAPPLMAPVGLSPDLRERFPGYDLSMIALHEAVTALPDGCELVVLLPEIFFTGQTMRRIREHIFSRASARTVIWHSHPWLELGMDLGPFITMHTLHMTVGNKSGPIRFTRLPAIADSDEATAWLDDFRVLNSRGGGITRYGYVIRDPLPSDGTLSYNLYCPDTVEREASLQHLGEVKRLSDLFDIHVGTVVASRRRESETQSVGAGALVLGGREIRSDGAIMFDEVSTRIDVPENLRLKPGDICVRAHRSTEPIQCAIFPSGAPPAVASSSLLVLRPHESLTEEDVLLCQAYLQSEIAAALLNPRQVGISVATSLGELPVPLADTALRTALREINESEQRFQGWVEDARRAKRALFRFSALEQTRVEILATGRTARQRARAGEQLEDIGYRIRSQFPHPIAFRWRTVESCHSDTEGYLQVLDCAEVAACYTACLAVAAVDAAHGLRIGRLGEIAKQVGRGGSGIGMGHWVAILREMRDSKKLCAPAEFPFPELLTFLSEAAVDEVLQVLSTRRNDQAHRRGPKGAGIEVAFHDARAELLVFLTGLEFLADYPLWHVENTRRDSRRRATLITYRQLMGDHALMPLSLAESDDPEIEAGSLYVVGRDQALCLLRPLMVRRECPTCHQEATFYLDKYVPKEDSCTLTSMEHGHSITDPQIAALFRQVGLLPARP